jgi:hypothetical protein
MRFAKQRDACDLAIFKALQAAGRKPVRGNDVDIFCLGIDSRGVLIECKVPGKRNRLRPIQVKLKELFGDRYQVVTNVDEALLACGIKI